LIYRFSSTRGRSLLASGVWWFNRALQESSLKLESSFICHCIDLTKISNRKPRWFHKTCANSICQIEALFTEIKACDDEERRKW
jgi:hypothetical protein